MANSAGEFSITDVYRYGSINGVKLAIPTANGGVTPQFNSESHIYGTTANGYGSADNPTYSDLVAIWDAANGTGTSAGYINGTPPGWSGPYWSSTPTASSTHVSINLYMGIFNGGSSDDYLRQVVLQVL